MTCGHSSRLPCATSPFQETTGERKTTFEELNTKEETSAKVSDTEVGDRVIISQSRV